MPSFRRAVIRLLLITAFLLFIAWLAMKAMQYGGDWGKVLRDLVGDTEGIERFFKEQVMPRLRGAGEFFSDKLGPWAREMAGKVGGAFGR